MLLVHSAIRFNSQQQRVNGDKDTPPRFLVTSIVNLIYCSTSDLAGLPTANTHARASANQNIYYISRVDESKQTQKLTFHATATHDAMCAEFVIIYLFKFRRRKRHTRITFPYKEL